MSTPHRIDLDQPKRGYRRFITCWLHEIEGRVALVDPGPDSTIPHLTSELARLGVDRVDLILLTHIHLDHAGGTGRLCAAHPEARVVCFPPAAEHLVDPGRLWEGSRAVLGENADLFGAPRPVRADVIESPESLVPLGVETIPTPGHAAHHLCYLDGDLLFIGEAAGMTCPTAGAGHCLRPATPPRFLLPTALESLDRLLALDPFPERVAFAHYGLHTSPRRLVAAARRQLGLWTDVLAEFTEPGARTVPGERREALIRTLVAADPAFAPFDRLEPDLRDREREFLANTWAGMLGWLAAADAAGNEAPI